MKLIISSLVTLLLSFGFISDQSNKELQLISFPEFEEMTNEKSDKIRIFNFWATWCAPCVKEMPYFQKVKDEDPKLDLIFISMDDGRKPERVTTFMERRNVSSPVYLLNDVDYNKWIDKVDPSWSGAIPATLFVKPDGSRFFHEGEVTEEELKEMIKQLK
ncbi:TlpA family protein disulfide reductase [Arthrospiribacter ruber]|uniref:TlpA family protein disulfide reductase n=1 Tax=Arthrospiribacter ruber TaxID=2487934 RepID=A0A951MBM9_9BACT|nr:TlpA disulfide reductase family protein [Arthrospiribacter ruber]MBW3467364.1 TlpA family protein disulfide reductase [Arthrospiribacter ruber]